MGISKVRPMQKESNIVLKGGLTKMASNNTFQGNRMLLLLTFHLWNSDWGIVDTCWPTSWPNHGSYGDIFITGVESEEVEGITKAYDDIMQELGQQ